MRFKFIKTSLLSISAITSLLGLSVGRSEYAEAFSYGPTIGMEKVHYIYSVNLGLSYDRVGGVPNVEPAKEIPGPEIEIYQMSSYRLRLKGHVGQGFLEVTTRFRR